MQCISWTFTLRFVVPCIFNHSNKTTNQMQQSIVKFTALSYRHCSTCFGHYSAHHQEPDGGHYSAHHQEPDGGHCNA